MDSVGLMLKMISAKENQLDVFFLLLEIEPIHFYRLIKIQLILGKNVLH